MFYICLFGFLLVWLALGYVKSMPIKIYILLPLLLMGLVIGLRYQTGKDLDNYELLFSYAVNRQTEQYYGAELSYILLSQIFDFLQLDFQAMVLTYSLVSFLLIYKGLCVLQVGKREYAGFICTFYALGFSTFFILMRQFLSASIIFYAFARYGQKRAGGDLLKCFILLIAATLIHRGAVVMIPLFFLFGSKLFKRDSIKGISVILAILAGSSSLVFYMIQWIVRYLPQYAYYLEKENFGVGHISKVIFLLTVFYLAILCLKQKYGNCPPMKHEASSMDKIRSGHAAASETISRGICFCLVIYYSTLTLGWFHRSYWYMTLFLYFIPSYLLSFFSCKKATVYLYVCLSTLYIIAIFYNIKISEPLMVPYQFNLSLFKPF